MWRQREGVVRSITTAWLIEVHYERTLTKDSSAGGKGDGARQESLSERGGGDICGHRGAVGGNGIFGIKEAAKEVAWRMALAEMAQQIAAYDQGYKGG